MLPTDTLPALAVTPRNAAKIWKIKRRPLNKPLILMASTAQELFEHVQSYVLPDASRMAKKYWPGALTLVLPAVGEIVEALNPGASTLGVRVPACAQPRLLLKSTGPLATTSANIAGNKSTENSDEASAIFPDLPLLGPVPWPNSSGMASTVIAWEKEGLWKVLRHGPVDPDLYQK